MVAGVAVAVPLTLHTQTKIEEASLRRSVTSALVDWDDRVRVVSLTADVVDGTATVELLVAGSNEPRAAWKLASEIQRRFDGPVDLELSYQRDELFVVSVR